MSTRETRSYGGPLLGEPLPIELANTIHLVRGRTNDGMQSVDDLAAWLDGVRPRLDTPLSDDDVDATSRSQLAQARDLRDCLRELTDATVQDLRPNSAVLDRLNRHARSAVRWKELRWEHQPDAETCSSAPPVATALSEIAQLAVELFADSRRRHIRACGAPGCILFFLKDHPRRAWCSAGCGNRVRAARHYERTRRARG